MTDKKEDTPNLDEPARSAADSPKFAFDLNPNLAEWIDRESARIGSLVRDLTDRIPQRQEFTLHPDLPIAAHIGPEDIIGDIAISSHDVAGNMVARLYQHQGRVLGLADDAMSDAQKIAERIWSRGELRAPRTMTVFEHKLSAAADRSGF
jgi:hypothetical protein